MSQDLQELVDTLLAGMSQIKVLDAGCGFTTSVNFDKSAYIVGMDISPAQLKNNQRIDKAIVGDIQVYDLPGNDFDVILCWEVLEHLPDPKKALGNMFGAVKVGGIIILAFPNIHSVKGLLTKFTPHWFHVLMYRKIYRDERAGLPGAAPFPVYMRLSMAPSAVQALAVLHSLSVVYAHYSESHFQRELRERLGIVDRWWLGIKLAVRVLTLGRIDAEQSEFILVLQRRHRLSPA
jgi:SAM-dependent methyltransferase